MLIDAAIVSCGVLTVLQGSAGTYVERCWVVLKNFWGTTSEKEIHKIVFVLSGLAR